jgi:hypothetical protein
MFIIGTLEDNITIFTFSYLFKILHSNFFPQIGYPFGIYFSIWNSSQPLFWTVYFFFSSLFNTLYVYNSILLLSLLFTWYQAKRFYSYFLKNRLVSVWMALLLVLSPYFYYQSQSHMDLIQVWALLLFINYLIRSTRFRHYILSALLLLATFLISNYLGFMGALFAGVYLFSTIFVTFIKTRNYKAVVLPSKNLILFSVCFVSLVGLFYFTYTNKAFLEPSIPKTTFKPLTTIDRAYSDFFEFSSRPWFLVIPSADNPMFGRYSTSALQFIKDTCPSFICRNYFKKEHAALYLGLVNIAVVLLAIRPLLKKIKSETSYLVLVFTFVILFCISLPPYVTLWGAKLYLPSQLFYITMPFFRVLSRLGLVLLLIFLIFVGYAYLYLYAQLKTKPFLVKYGTAKIIMAGLFILGFIDFFIPIKIYSLSRVPLVYTHIAQVAPLDAAVAIYPYSRTDDALFWLPYFQRNLVNPRGIAPNQTIRDYQVFTDNLQTSQGLHQARELGADYLVYFYKDFPEAESFFALEPTLEKVGNFEEKPYSSEICQSFLHILCDWKIFRISGVGVEDSAILYKIKVIE